MQNYGKTQIKSSPVLVFVELLVLQTRYCMTLTTGLCREHGCAKLPKEPKTSVFRVSKFSVGFMMCFTNNVVC